MNVRTKTPNNILVNVDYLKSAVSDDETRRTTIKEYENSKNMTLALAGALTSCLLTLIPSWSIWGIVLRIIITFFSLVFAIATFCFGIKWIEAKKILKHLPERDLADQVIDEVKKKIRYTALLIISYQKTKSGEVTFMTEKQGNYLIHCDMDPYKRIEEQEENIINYLATSYDVPKNCIVKINPLSRDPFFSIKPIRNEETQNGFVFFKIKLRKKAKQNLTSHRNACWITIQEMERNAELMGRNQDIIMALNEIKIKIEDSFDDAAHGSMHIIWNITKKCPYRCAICATRDDLRGELSTEEKLQVLNNIFSAKKHISTLDFAGGDPMYDSGIRTVIMQAINSLGEDYVSVTTTGRGIQAIEGASEEVISKLLRRCEITIDASHENLGSDSKASNFPRKSPNYCNYNYTQIQNTSDNLRYLTINIPLLDDDLDDMEINDLILKLKKLKQDYSEIQMEAQIIRLMPVGAFINSDGYSSNYEMYNPIDLAKKIRERIEEIGIACRYHCSLRVLPNINGCDRRCTMLDKKIGIDCSGNVFACTWGAYLHIDNDDITKNPFYLGNLVTTSLKSILEGQGNKTFAYKRISRDIVNKADKPYCEAVSWYFKNALNENNDPLSK